MAYQKQTWENSPSTNTPVSAERLNHMEDGIYEAYEHGGGGETLPVGSEIDYDGETVPTGWEQVSDLAKILWTNSNPTSSFSGQTIQLSETLDNYDCYEIIHRQSTTNSRFLTTGKIPVGHGTFMANVLSLNQYRGTNEITSGSSVTFTAGYQAQQDGSFTEDNNLVIPVYVIGHKTGLFS